MPTTKYDDGNLSFLPSQQWWTHQSQYFPGIINDPPIPSFTGAATSSQESSSSESEFNASEMRCENSNSPIQSPDTTTTEDVMAMEKPFLQLVEPPVESLRFRYPTEMKGTHGSILGISSLSKKDNCPKKKQTFPSVKLCNYEPSPDKKVIIRCTLTTADDDIESRIPHVHHLKGKGKTSSSQSRTVEIDDPIDVQVSSPHFQAVFGNMTILFIKKGNQLDELVKKKKRHIRKMLVNPHQKFTFTEKDALDILGEAQKVIDNMNSNRLNTACLKFEALEAGHDQLCYSEICPPVYSKPIKNIKHFNDLKIVRIDRVAGSCLGREEVFIFVDKVNKKDIRVRFFELDEQGEEIWQAEAEMNEDDVHYQYAIAFRTPCYRNTSITDNVKVYFQLERPSNSARSSPKVFEYIPDPNRWLNEIRKRPRRDSPPIDMLLAGFCNLDKDPSGDTLMDEIPGGDVNYSLNNFLSNMDSGDSEILQQMMNSDAFLNWGLSNGESEDYMEYIRSEVTNSVNQSRPSPSNQNLTYGVKKCNVFEEPSNEEEKGNKFEMQGAYETDGVLNCRITAQHQGSMASRNATDKGVRFEMQGVYNSQIAGKSTISKPLQKNWNLPQTTLKMAERDKVKMGSIVSKLYKLVSGCLYLEKTGKIKGKDLKHRLQAVFKTCVDTDDDRVLHVLASYQDFPPEMLRFSHALKLYQIADSIIDLKNNKGQTALHIAVEKGSIQTIALLIECGANVNTRDKQLNTPLHLVASRMQGDVCDAIACLLETSPNLTIYNEDGLTALHLFVIKRKVEAISSIFMKNESFILKADALNLGDGKEGNTALHLAVKNKCLEIVGLLLNFGDNLDVNAKNFAGKPPLAYVSCGTNEDKKIEELLLKNKADPIMAYPKTIKKLDELKIDEYEDKDNSEDDVRIVEDIDESLSSYAQDWKTERELKLMDRQKIESFCQVLDENQDWLRLLESLAIVYPLQCQDSLIPQLKTRWSPTLYLLKFVAKELPSVTKEYLRDILMKINADCRKAAQFIDDMVLSDMGVF